jgi:hypothetical protein
MGGCGRSLGSAEHLGRADLARRLAQVSGAA